MRRRFALVFNRHAGIERPRRLAATLSALEAAGAEIRPLETTSAEDATAQVRALAHAGAVDAVIAAGGDGTIRAVAAGVAGTAVPLGIVPLGTGNVLKYEIGLSSRPGEIAKVLLQGPEVEMQGGFVNGAPFFLMAGAGFDARIVNALKQPAKKRLGRLAYGGPIMGALLAPPDRIDVEIDGEPPVRASWVIVTNASRYGGSFKLTDATNICAPGFMVVLVHGNSRAALLGASLRLGLGALANVAQLPKGITARRCNSVRITGAGPVPVEIDGDEGGFAPVHVTSGGPPVRLLVPQARVADLTNRHTNHLR